MHRWELGFYNTVMSNTMTVSVVAGGPEQALEVSKETLYGRNEKYELVKLERREYVTLPLRAIEDHDAHS